MRRLYSTFAGGRRGIGLILMRLVVGLVLVQPSGSAVLANPPIAMAIMFVHGRCRDSSYGRIMYPIVGTLVALIESCRLFIIPADWLVYLLVATLERLPWQC